MKSNVKFAILGSLIFLILLSIGCNNNESSKMQTIQESINIRDSLKVKEESLTQTINWEWAKGAIGKNDNGEFSDVSGNNIVTDSEGNVFVVGDFYGGTIAFDKILSKSIAKGNIKWNSFFTKFDAKGNVQWVKIIQEYDVTGIAIDSDNNVYMISGQYILKYNSDGKKIWEKNNEMLGYSIAINSQNGFYVIGSKNYPNKSLIKYDSNGNILWTKDLKASFGSEEEKRDITADIAVDNVGNVYLSGGYSSAELKFGNTILRRVGLNCSSEGDNCDMESTNGYVIKCDASGNVIWSKNRGQSDRYNYTHFTFLALNKEGDVYLTGQADDAFLTKYDKGGNEKWTKNILNCNKMNHRINSISINNYGNIYVCGFSWCESITFGQFNESAINGNLSFIVKYNSKGEVLSTKSLENLPNQNNKVISNCNGIASDNSGNVFITGNYEDGGLRFGNTTLSEQQFNKSFFLAKLKIE